MSAPSHKAVERLDLEQTADRLQVALHQQRYEFVLARLQPADSVLEVGTGTGGLSRMILGKCKEFTGLEYDAGACEMTRRRLERPAAVHQGDAQSMPFPSASFSAVVCLEVLEHLPNYRKALGEIHRCLTPGGRAFVSVPYRRRGGPNPQNRFHLYEPGESELVAALRQHFSNVETYYQYFEESPWMTFARLCHLRSLMGLSHLYRDLALGTPLMTARLKVGSHSKGWRINLLLQAKQPLSTPTVGSC